MRQLGKMMLRAGAAGLVLASIGAVNVAASPGTEEAAGGPVLRGAPAARCGDGAYLDLYRQDGTAFETEAACRRHPPSKLVQLKVFNVGGYYTVKVTSITSDEVGFGLAPGSEVVKCAVNPDGVSSQCRPPHTVAADGTHFASDAVRYTDSGVVYDSGLFDCWNPYVIPNAYVTDIYLLATTAAGSPVRSRAVSTGC